MCGIAGSFGAPNSNHVLAVNQMLQSIRHRGPDGKGMVALSDERCEYFKSKDNDVDLLSSIPIFDARVVLGQVRLAILDLSEAGLQPMQSANGKIWMVFNGEIYNYIEIRQDLLKLGHNFHTNTDTEVVLAAYCEWGRNMLELLDGMFAFAICDTESRKIFCARDRFGEKPFFYQIQRNCIRFASEIKALLASGSHSEINLNSVAKYLVNTQVYFGSETFFDGISQLPASNYLEVNWDEPEKYSIRPYYPGPEMNGNLDHSTDFPTQFRERLEHSVKLRLRADVPVGTCLSGGLDSSAVVSLALRNLDVKGPEFHAFTAIPDVQGYSELEWAKVVLSDKHATLHEVNVSADNVREGLDDFLLSQDEPVPSLSMFMQYQVMKAARKNNIPVLLDGQGGDELLLGYSSFYAFYIFQLLTETRFGKAWTEFNQYSENGSISKKRLLALVGYAYPPIRKLWRSLNRGRLLNPEILKLVGMGSERYANIKEAQESHIWVQPLPALLRFEDRNAMRFSVETRLPLLDHKLVEFCVQAAVDVKLHEGWTKWMLRQSMDGIMPSKIAWRRDKKGFDSPDRIWMRALGDSIRDMGASAKSSVFYSKKTPSQLINLTMEKNPAFAWRVFCLEKWLQLYQVSV